MGASRPKKDTIIDVLLVLARQRAELADANGNADADRVKAASELPSNTSAKFRSCIEQGLSNISKAKYYRRGMKNDANNCYMNVVIQSLLPCSALMQLLSHCNVGDGS